jgi:hypothetical protein
MVVLKVLESLHGLYFLEFFLFWILTGLCMKVIMKRRPRSNRIQLIVFRCAGFSLKVGLVFCESDSLDEVWFLDWNFIVVWILHLFLWRLVHFNGFSWDLVWLNLLSFSEGCIITLLIFWVILACMRHYVECLFLLRCATTTVICKCWFSEICCKCWIG